MKCSKLFPYLFIGIFSFSSIIVNYTRAQSITATITGKVLDSMGKPKSSMQVEIVHEGTKVTKTVTTDEHGKYYLSGLQVGGPYTIKTTDGQKMENVYLKLDETLTIHLDASQKIETLEVVGASTFGKSDIFYSDNMGARTNITQEQIISFPSIRRSIDDYVRFDPRVVQNKSSGGGFAVGGSNNRYNNLRIDGVSSNDQFGLNSSGFPALNQPISIDWIAEINVGVSNYDVTQKDFVGGNVNAVSKSGTNEFKGGGYAVFRNNSMIRKNDSGQKFQGFEDEFTGGAYLGGPILSDKLFFFAGYEKFKRTAPGAITCPNSTTCDNIVNVSQTEINDIKTTANNLGFGDIGTQSSKTDSFDHKYFFKVNLNAHPNHDISFRFNRTDGQALRISTSTTTLQLSSNYYDDVIKFQNYALNTTSRWTDRFTTEANFSYSDYSSLPSSYSTKPVVAITVRTNANVIFGRERSRHANELDVKTKTAYVAGDLFMDDHTYKFGVDHEDVDVRNLFLQDYYGNYTFTSIATFKTGKYSKYTLQRPKNGNLESVAAKFNFGNTGIFLQDSWEFSSNLALMYGLRTDIITIGNKPSANSSALTKFGYDTTSMPNGKVLIEPRLGANYQFDFERKTQLRGGLGLYQGSAPGVWIGNSFSNPGGLAIAYSDSNTAGTSVASYDPNNPKIPTSITAAQLVNFLDPKFQQPSVWKTNVGFEHVLPWYDLVAGFETVYTKTNKAVMYEHLNLGTPYGTLPDGRNYYFASVATSGFASNKTPTQKAARDTNYTDVLLLKNTSKGYGYNLTWFVEKIMKDEWSAKVGYTLGKSEDVSPALASVALTNWAARVIFNPNEDTLSRSDFETRSRFMATISKTWHLTNVSVFYEGRSGAPISYTYSGDANGDGVAGNDVFYVPNGDIEYTSDSTDKDKASFLDYLNSNKDLSENKGKVLSRNSSRGPWVHQVDLRITQKFPVYSPVRGEFYFDFQNLTNFINKDWGRIDSSNLAVARMAGVNNGKYVYDVTNYYNETTGTSGRPTMTRLNSIGESNWSMQLGLRVLF